MKSIDLFSTRSALVHVGHPPRTNEHFPATRLVQLDARPSRAARTALSLFSLLGCASWAVAQSSAEATRVALAPVIAWGDFDGDSHPDIYAIYSNGSERLLRNNADGTFVDASTAVGLGGLAGSRAARWADFDRDGLLDLYLVSSRSTQRLFRNEGRSGFVDVTATAGLEQRGDELDAEWLDFDGDGALDLAVRTLAGDVLYHNDGSAGFSVVSLELSVDAPGALPAGGAAATDTRSDTGAGATRTSEGRTRTDGRHPVAPRSRGETLTASSVTGPATVTSLGGGINATSPMACASGIMDDANPSSCLSASTIPVLGKLFPLTKSLFVTPAGRVGVGTDTPEGPLHVIGASGSQALSVGPEFSGRYGGMGFTSAASNRVWLTASGAEDVTIDSQGKVGVGTTPYRQLHVAGYDGQVIGIGPHNSSTLYGALGMTGGALHRFWLSASGAEDLSISSQGKVAIGAPASDYSLLVQSRSDAPQRKLLNIQDLNSAGSGGTELVVTGENFGLNLTNNWGPLSFGASNAGLTNQRSVIIDPSGNVAIGTSPSTSKLLVNGEIRSVAGGFRFPDGSVQVSASAQGAQGPEGPQGPPGPQGPQGPAGGLAIDFVGDSPEHPVTFGPTSTPTALGHIWIDTDSDSDPANWYVWLSVSTAHGPEGWVAVYPGGW